MEITDGLAGLAPRSVALLYALTGGAWIFVSDRLVALLISDGSLLTTVQTMKGWAFVGISAMLVYALVGYSRAELERTNDRLDDALQQTSILHRILRHNLRNSCNVIRGYTRRLADDVDPEYVRVVEEQTDTLVELAERTRLMRNVVLTDVEPSTHVDVPRTVGRAVETVRDRYPDATIETDLPDRATVEAHPEIDTAVRELLDNAVVHTEGDVDVTVTGRADDGDITLEIADEGPGIPEMEREVLATGVERPTVHSMGLGLWLARTIVNESGGRLEIDDDPTGSVVRVTIP